MNKATLALTTLAALMVAPVALAQATGSPPTTPDPSMSGHTHSGQTQSGQTQSGQTQSGQTQSQYGQTQGQMQPGQMQPGQMQMQPGQTGQTSGQVQTSTTTVTAADATPVPPPTITPTPRETVTLHQSVRPNRPLFYTGSVLFLGTYVTTAVLTAVNTENGGGDKTMYLPVVGPILHLADIEEDATDTALMIGSAALQGIGVGLALVSLFVPEKIPAATIQAGGVKINVTATSFGKNSGGIGAVGRF